MQNLSQQLKQGKTVSHSITETSVKMDQWIQAFHHIADAMQSTGNILVKMKAPTKPEQAHSKSESPIIFDLFQSPMMGQIVRDVIKLRKDNHNL